MTHQEHIRNTLPVQPQLPPLSLRSMSCHASSSSGTKESIRNTKEHIRNTLGTHHCQRVSPTPTAFALSSLSSVHFMSWTCTGHAEKCVCVCVCVCVCDCVYGHGQNMDRRVMHHHHGVQRKHQEHIRNTLETHQKHINDTLETHDDDAFYLFLITHQKHINDTLGKQQEQRERELFSGTRFSNLYTSTPGTHYLSGNKESGSAPWSG